MSSSGGNRYTSPAAVRRRTGAPVHPDKATMDKSLQNFAARIDGNKEVLYGRQDLERTGHTSSPLPRPKANQSQAEGSYNLWSSQGQAPAKAGRGYTMDETAAHHSALSTLNKAGYPNYPRDIPKPIFNGAWAKNSVDVVRRAGKSFTPVASFGVEAAASNPYDANWSREGTIQAKEELPALRDEARQGRKAAADTAGTMRKAANNPHQMSHSRATQVRTSAAMIESGAGQYEAGAKQLGLGHSDGTRRSAPLKMAKGRNMVNHGRTF
jgi:hypothetical protein